MNNLPPELVAKILEYLDLADLRRAAAVSRDFYAIAWQAGLYIHRNIRWSADSGGFMQHTTLNELVRHALKKDRLRLSFSCSVMSFSLELIEKAPFPSSIHDLLSLITSASPVLVSLKVMGFPRFIASLAAALRHSAPNLAALDITVPLFYVGIIVQDLSVGLFSGCAPKLRRLTLQNIPLGREPVAAFSCLDSVRLGYGDQFPPIELVRHFPLMRNLHVRLMTESHEPLLLSLNLDGASDSLRKLTIQFHHLSARTPVILTGTDMSGVPDVEHFGSAIVWSDRLWHRAADGPISIRLMWRSVREISISIVPEHGRWRRVYNRDDWAPGKDEFPVLRLPGLRERLTYLRMDNNLLPSFLECNGLSLGTLRKLHIDFHVRTPFSPMIWPPDWLHVLSPLDINPYSFSEQDTSAHGFSKPSYCYVECGALECLAFFAMDKAIAVQSGEVAFLGRALSQCARRAQDRATLELFGVDFHVPVVQALLDETFAEVRRHDFEGGNSMPGRDGGLWDREPRP
ncbi:hypothetical protein AURDEDRAFT_175819 [Auricularia subglabra TFB-10046 SS5]|uniref:F-box domain-containing protein n=1 Tax=Auricularia subglabra (strain TFB-10046 / SS5) TaxID=717982 RepID=J0WSE8_AURST|nr:hypothetical protein AURDEDRAFT_175819 [Auricularia subglabra TFB-10046 SS5]